MAYVLKAKTNTKINAPKSIPKTFLITQPPLKVFTSLISKKDAKFKNQENQGFPEIALSGKEKFFSLKAYSPVNMGKNFPLQGF
ncbi:hypothetical protein TH606_04645 [Thermodesulfatator autotrophicus]|uniref:Uncharacterized protein n=1 Tax=Thermodesulfatator autotrophicus TaxID=1795632 RepID=A0A177E7B0_9BACT|nr:hypothetical protein TH606_04645 [Thermodesulfatator autotrophicus]